MKYSSGLIKPDGVERGITREIFSLMESVGLKIILSKQLRLTSDDVRVVYGYCVGSPHYSELENFMCSGDVVFYVVGANHLDAVTTLNVLVGSTDPKHALKESIRGMYGSSVARNVIHSTQTLATFRQEIERFLSKKELIDIMLID